MTHARTSGDPIPVRQLTIAEYHRLGEIGVLGERIELIDGIICCGDYPFVFSPDAVAAAREAGIELDERTCRATAGPRARTTLVA
jgi:hypothetical protein